MKIRMEINEVETEKKDQLIEDLVISKAVKVIL